MRKIKTLIYGVAYLFCIPLFAFLYSYCLPENSFYQSTIKIENTYTAHARDIANGLCDAVINQSISSCTFLLTGHPCANCNDPEKIRFFYQKPSLKYSA